MAEGTTDGYAHALRREILRSERQRMGALAIILAVLLAATVTSSIVLTDLSHRLFLRGIDPMLPLLAIGPLVAYQMSALTFFRLRILPDHDLPRHVRLLHALIPVSPAGLII